MKKKKGFQHNKNFRSVRPSSLRYPAARPATSLLRSPAARPAITESISTIYIGLPSPLHSSGGGFGLPSRFLSPLPPSRSSCDCCHHPASSQKMSRATHHRLHQHRPRPHPAVRGVDRRSSPSLLVGGTARTLQSVEHRPRPHPRPRHLNFFMILSVGFHGVQRDQTKAILSKKASRSPPRPSSMSASSLRSFPEAASV